MNHCATGYATADVFASDNDYIDIELKYGQHGSNNEKVENYKLNRETMEIEDA